MKSLKFFALGLALTFGAAANAQPPADVLKLIESTYDPAISVESNFGELSIAGCWKKEITLTTKDPVTLSPRKVRLKQYAPLFNRHPENLKTVLVMPPTGGENILDQLYSNALCRAGFRAVMVQGWDDDTFTELDAKMHDRGALKALAAIRQAVEYAVGGRSDVKVGILGTSVGAISSSFAAGFDSRISTAVLIVGGIGMPEIIGASTEKTLTRLRAERSQAFGYKSVEEYQAALAKTLVVEPGDFIGHSGPKKVFMVLATQDVTVPTKNQWDLYRAFGNQELRTFEGNHIEAIKASPKLYLQDMIAFLQQNL